MLVDRLTLAEIDTIIDNLSCITVLVAGLVGAVTDTVCEIRILAHAAEILGRASLHLEILHDTGNASLLFTVSA
jgi:hypothetical protein